MGLRGDFAGAAAALHKAVELSEGKDWRCLAALADAHDRTGRSAEAYKPHARGLDLALQEQDSQLEQKLRADLRGYEAGQGKARRPLVDSGQWSWPCRVN